ncbi:amiloride-sensitive sodium channel domain-containing protein [Ditylenchus destructor]|nr:amiloride-sensitive sodium channel domain-containing protein [Ditylenchus destructor]
MPMTPKRASLSPPFDHKFSLPTSPPKILVMDENGDKLRNRESLKSLEETGQTSSCNGLASSRNSSQIRLSLSSEAKKLTTKASELIIRVPAMHFKKIAKTRGMSSVSRETQHFVGITTVNGLLRIYRSKGAYKLFWVLMTSLCFCLLFWQVGALIQMYLKKPTVSQVSFLLPDQGLLFPTITVCSYNPIKRSYIENVNKTGQISRRLLDYITLAFMEVQYILSINNPQDLELANQEHEYLVTHTHPEFTLNGFFWNASLTCEEMLKICSFGGREFNCCQYAKGVLTDIGKCYQLDLSKSDEPWLKQQVQPGVNNGLQVIADFHIEQQIGGFEMDSSAPFSNEFETGFRYYVHGSGTMPYLSTEGISVSPGTKVYSAISPTKYVLLPLDNWGNCTSEWPEDYGSPMSPDEDYSSMRCKTLCRAKYFNDLCGCSPFIYNVEGYFPVCTPYEIFECLNSTVLSGHADDADNFYQILPSCTACKIECNRMIYHTYNSYAQGFSRGSLAWLRRRNSQWSPGHVRSNFVAINIFFRENCYTEYKQVRSMTVTEIASDIGGNMGLFLGMSLISLAELIIFLTKISWIFISKRRRDHMLAKKREDEDRERRLQETLEMAANRGLHTPFPKNGDTNIIIENGGVCEPHRFTERMRRLAGSFRRKAAIWPHNHFYADQPNNNALDVPLNHKKSRRDSILSIKSMDSINSGIKKRVDFVDTVVRNKLFGDGRAVHSSGSDEDILEGDDELLELKIDLDAFKRSNSGNTMIQECPISTSASWIRDSSSVHRRRTNSVAVVMVDQKDADDTAGLQTMQAARHRSASHAHVAASDPEQKLIVPSLLMRNLQPMVKAQAQLATSSNDDELEVSGTGRVEPTIQPVSILKHKDSSNQKYDRKLVAPSLLIKNLRPMVDAHTQIATASDKDFNHQILDAGRIQTNDLLSSQKERIDKSLSNGIVPTNNDQEMESYSSKSTEPEL